MVRGVILRMGLSHSKHEEQQMKRTSTLLVAILAAGSPTIAIRVDTVPSPAT